MPLKKVAVKPNTMTIASVVGARPNFIKLAAMAAAVSEEKISHVIIHTGQHYDFEMSQVFFEGMALPKPDYNLEVGSGTQGAQLGEMTKRCEAALLKVKPHLVLVYGDTNSTLAGGLAASKNNIPLGHIEAGLRSFDMRMQEEKNRVLVDHISDYLFCPTQTAMENLKREGLATKSYMTGDVMVDSMVKFSPPQKLIDSILSKLGLRKKGYVLTTIHRAENTDSIERLSRIITALNDLSKEIPIVFPMHPRTEGFLKKYGLLDKISNLVVTKPQGYLEFLALEKYAKRIVTDSGGVQKEAYILGVPCITLRESTEWVETVKDGWNVLVGADRKKMFDQTLGFKPPKTGSNLFGDGHAAERILAIIRKDTR